jgi:hypothetical protein
MNFSRNNEGLLELFRQGRILLFFFITFPDPGIPPSASRRGFPCPYGLSTTLREKALSLFPERKRETMEKAVPSLSRENRLSTGGKRHV